MQVDCHTLKMEKLRPPPT